MNLNTQWQTQQKQLPPSTQQHTQQVYLDTSSINYLIIHAFHSLPHLNMWFELSNSTFDPNSSDYLEVSFIITNFGVWATGRMYAKNFSGLVEAYAMGLPFFRNTLVGDVFFNLLFFAGYHFLLFISKKIALHIRYLSHYYLS